jgi:hypothetical protein
LDLADALWFDAPRGLTPRILSSIEGWR